MDKRKVIAAYRRGYISLLECAQILGMEAELAAGLLNEGAAGPMAPWRKGRTRHPVGG